MTATWRSIPPFTGIASTFEQSWRILLQATAGGPRKNTEDTIMSSRRIRWFTCILLELPAMSFGQEKEPAVIYQFESPTGGYFGTIPPFLLGGTFFSSGGFVIRVYSCVSVVRFLL